MAKTYQLDNNIEIKVNCLQRVEISTGGEVREFLWWGI